MTRVLIIESDRARAYRLSAMCRRLGLQPHLSPDPLHGLMRALRDKPDIILVDAKDDWAGTLSFPDALRRDGVLSSIPVIVLGGEPDGRATSWATIYGGNGEGRQLEHQIRAALAAGGGSMGPLEAGLSDRPAILPNIVRDPLNKPLD
ncbi:MAG TPA: hypothetical protein VJZ71_12395 [Phycisphaerae bacterium]|nr:hypothetical protein [Phycisphaerae bacterium]